MDLVGSRHIAVHTDDEICFRMIFFQETKHIILRDSRDCCGIYPTAQLAERTAELVKFYLKASARGIGIGKKLMAKCIESAQVMGYNQLYLESLPEFKNAVAMYERANFAYLDQPLGNSGHFGCNIWMVKQL